MGQERYYPDEGEELPDPVSERACKASWEVFRSIRTHYPHWEKLDMSTRVNWRQSILRAFEVIRAGVT